MDFDDAFANAAYIPDGGLYPERWMRAAQAFRDNTETALEIAYGDKERQKLDLFLPEGKPKGLVVFVHGGYWLRFDKNYWSHFAAGPLAQGWAVAMPGYDVCPDVRITQIGQQIDKAIALAATHVDGPIRLAGHSAGGQLVARVAGLPDPTGWSSRLERIVPISPVADLVPLMHTTMNRDLGITDAEALRESPIHHEAPAVPVSIWVGADERPVFLDQADKLSQAWKCAKVVLDGCHHFNILDGLKDSDSALTADLCL